MTDNDMEERRVSESSTPFMARRFFSFRHSPAHVSRLTQALGLHRDTTQANSDQAEKLPITPLRSNQLTPSIHLELPARSNITSDRLRRGAMFDNLIKYETNYMRTLVLLTLDCYDELILDETILPRSTAREIFAYLPEMRVLHQHFRGWMAKGARHWNEREMAGWFFGALLEQPALLTTYSMFVANYKRAIIISESALKKDNNNNNFCNFMESRMRHVDPKLNFEDFFMKPVQRMIHMEQQIGEMLRETPTDHPDLPMLRLCSRRAKYIVSQLDELQGHISSLRSVLGPEFPNSIPTAPCVRKWRQSQLLHCEDLCRTVVNRLGVRKEKIYRIFLLNDRVVYTAVKTETSTEGRFETKLSLKWMLPLAEIEFQTISPSGAVHAHNAERTDAYMSMVRWMLDSSNASKIGSLVGTFHNTFSALNLSTVDDILSKCDNEMKKIDDEAVTADKCYNSCELLVSTKQDMPPSCRKKTHLVLFPDSAAKRRWYCNARLAQRALQSGPHSSGWWTDVNQLLATNEPVFVNKLMPGCLPQSTLSCWCYYAPNLAAGVYDTLHLRGWLVNRRTLWICTLNGPDTTVMLYTHELLSNNLVRRTHFFVENANVECIVHVPRGRVVPDDATTDDTVWMGSTNRLMIYSGSYPLLDKQLLSVPVIGRPVQMLQRANRVYVGLFNGSILIYRMDSTAWNLHMPLVVNVSFDPIVTLLCIKGDVYVAAGMSVSVIDGKTDRLRGKIKVEEKSSVEALAVKSSITCMAYSVNGMWLARNRSSIVSLYRLSPWKHLQDIDLTMPSHRFSPTTQQFFGEYNICVTSIALIDDLLWIGTNIGYTMMMALPMRRNVPLIGDFLYGAKHGHLGNVNMLLPLIPAIEELVDPCPDDEEAGYAAFDFPQANHNLVVDESHVTTENEYDSISSLYEDVNTSSERSNELASTDTSLLDLIEQLTEQASFTGAIPKAPMQTASHQPESKSSSSASLSFTGAIPKPPDHTLRSEPKPSPVSAQVADTHDPSSVLILAGGGGYLNWHKWETLDAHPYPMGPGFKLADAKFDDDCSINEAHIVVWEKRLNRSFKKFD